MSQLPRKITRCGYVIPSRMRSSSKGEGFRKSPYSIISGSSLTISAGDGETFVKDFPSEANRVVSLTAGHVQAQRAIE